MYTHLQDLAHVAQRGGHRVVLGAQRSPGDSKGLVEALERFGKVALRLDTKAAQNHESEKILEARWRDNVTNSGFRKRSGEEYQYLVNCSHIVQSGGYRVVLGAEGSPPDSQGLVEELKRLVVFALGL